MSSAAASGSSDTNDVLSLLSPADPPLLAGCSSNLKQLVRGRVYLEPEIIFEAYKSREVAFIEDGAKGGRNALSNFEGTASGAHKS